jgi:hypothetical protein
MHPDCIRTGKHSGGLFAPGMLRRQEVATQGACAQPPDPSWAGRREHSKVLIQPAEEQSLWRRIGGAFRVQSGERFHYDWA